jgi:hypothetical protein
MMFLRNGIAKWVWISGGLSWTSQRTATVPMTNWASSLKRLGRPRELRRVSLRMSSAKPMVPKPMVM